MTRASFVPSSCNGFSDSCNQCKQIGQVKISSKFLFYPFQFQNDINHNKQKFLHIAYMGFKLNLAKSSVTFDPLEQEQQFFGRTWNWLVPKTKPSQPRKACLNPVNLTGFSVIRNRLIFLGGIPFQNPINSLMILILFSSATHSRHPPGQGGCPKQPSSNVSGVTWGWANATAEHPWPNDQPEHANPSTPSTSSTTTTTAPPLSTHVVSVLSMISLPLF